MRVLFVTAETGPFVSVGGLSQVSYFLPNALARAGSDIRIFTPKFGAMDQSRKKWKLEMEVEGLRVPLSDDPDTGDLICNVKSYEPKGEVKTYFLENREYYELRANVFGYKDDHVRFLLMCKGCLEWLLLQKERGAWFPELIHCNDWHSAYLIELARKSPRYRHALKEVKLVLTVHNFVYQGNYDYKYCSEADRDTGETPLDSLLGGQLQKQNALLRGILSADAISTVSPTHAKEVLTEEYGEGLHLILRKRSHKISGILNGLDVASFDPATDKLLKANFDQKNYALARAINKRELQKLFGLEVKEGTFLLAYCGRLVEQKGLALIAMALPHLLSEYRDIQIVFLGGGEESYRRKLTHLQERYPKQVGLHLVANFKLPRKMFAGADAVLIPSLFEPGGIVALESLRYGAVPIVRRTGGLNDVVGDFDPVTQEGNGYSFVARSAWSLYGAIVEAKTTFENKPLWGELVENCLEADFSWEASAQEYQKWYRQVRRET